MHPAVRIFPPPASATLAQPAIDVPPSVKVTVPVGANPLTLAVNVTLVPAIEGFRPVARLVVVVLTFTTCDSAPLAEAVLAASPP